MMPFNHWTGGMFRTSLGSIVGRPVPLQRTALIVPDIKEKNAVRGGADGI
jgi:hypothetical protein